MFFVQLKWCVHSDGKISVVVHMLLTDIASMVMLDSSGVEGDHSRLKIVASKSRKMTWALMVARCQIMLNIRSKRKFYKELDGDYEKVMLEVICEIHKLGWV